MVVDCVKAYIKMPDLNTFTDLSSAYERLDSYYEKEFEDQFAEFTNAVFTKMEIE